MNVYWDALGRGAELCDGLLAAIEAPTSGPAYQCSRSGVRVSSGNPAADCLGVSR
jgi:hypothetical protein